MAYQPWLQERIDKFKTFFADERPGQILVTLALWEMGVDFSEYGVEGRPLDAWNFETEVEAFADHGVQALRAATEIRREVGDDLVPCISPGIGIALNSVYYSGGALIPGASTTWTHPVINCWEDLDRLELNPDNRWFQVISRLNRRYLALNEGDYVGQTFSHFAPMDMANALRGNQLFLDFYDAPTQAHNLMQQCVEAIWWLEESQRAIVPQVDGGTVIWGVWLPGSAIFMSEDAPDLCSPTIYAEFGRPYTDQVARRAGGCYIHHHMLGLHVHREISQVRGLKQLQISLDPNRGRPIDHLSELFAWNGKVPLMTHCHTQDIYDKIDEMMQGRLILMLIADNLAEAREAIAFVRRHSRI